jgi:hypothetical protein
VPPLQVALQSPPGQLLRAVADLLLWLSGLLDGGLTPLCLTQPHWLIFGESRRPVMGPE